MDIFHVKFIADNKDINHHVIEKYGLTIADYPICVIILPLIFVHMVIIVLFEISCA